MTKQEIEKAIENCESVWLAYDDNIKKIHLTKHIQFNEFGFTNTNDTWRELYLYDKTFATKRQAEHYLHHANITRTEQFPFLTWEEFNKNALGFEFTDNIGNKYRCHIVRDYRDGKDFIVLYVIHGSKSIDEEYEATEENYYKAYDECVRLFKGEE